MFCLFYFNLGVYILFVVNLLVYLFCFVAFSFRFFLWGGGGEWGGVEGSVSSSDT